MKSRKIHFCLDYSNQHSFFFDHTKIKLPSSRSSSSIVRDSSESDSGEYRAGNLGRVLDNVLDLKGFVDEALDDPDEELVESLDDREPVVGLLAARGVSLKEAAARPATSDLEWFVIDEEEDATADVDAARDELCRKKGASESPERKSPPGVDEALEETDEPRDGWVCWREREEKILRDVVVVMARTRYR